jgi:hypothetical protein
MDDSARSFYLAHDDAFMIPVEALSPSGISPAFARFLQDEGRADDAWIESFNAAFSCYHRRGEDLWRRAGRYWFPPRLQNVCVLREHARAHPYLRLLSWSAWTVYEDDFRPQTSSDELAAFLFLHQERLNIVEDPQRTLVANLSYFLTLDDAAREDLCAGCEATQRPDAEAWRALGQAMDWIEDLHHVTLRPRGAPAGEDFVSHEDAGLEVRKDLLERVAALAQAFSDAAQAAVHAHFDRHSAADTCDGAELMAWLSSEAPEVLLVDHEGKCLWDFAAPENVEALAPRFAGIPVAAALSIREDLSVIHARTRAFLDAVKDPSSLPHCSEEVDQVCGTYLHHERDRIAYCLDRQSTWLPLREPSPPYQRLLLGARTGHEWGHLADESRLLRVAAPDRPAYEAAHRRLSTAFSQVYVKAPQTLRERAEGLTHRREGQDMGEALADFTLTRFPDTAANIVMSGFLEPAELECYVRVNARTHREEGLGPFALLSRFVLEAQYLRLSQILSDPVEYFLRNTACERLFVDTGLMTSAELLELLEAMQDVAKTYTLDPERIG